MPSGGTVGPVQGALKAAFLKSWAGTKLMFPVVLSVGAQASSLEQLSFPGVQILRSRVLPAVVVPSAFVLLGLVLQGQARLVPRSTADNTSCR